MKKTFLVIASIFIIAISLFTAPISLAEESKNVKIQAKSEILMDYYTGKVVSERNADERLPIASMVKIMTALLSFEAIEDGKLSLSDSVTVSEKASGMGGSQMFLEAGDRYSVSDLIKGIVVVSANDASVQMAELIAGSEDRFVEMMNARASELGMTNTRFVNSTGLPESGQYSTARDVAKMLKELSKHEEYYDYSRIWMEDFHHPDGRITEFVNTNKLIRFNKDCEGGKTGFTNEAKFCLGATAKRENTRLICVVIGAQSSKERFSRVTEMFNYGFSHYENVEIVKKGDVIKDMVSVRGGKTPKIQVVAESGVFIFRERGSNVMPEVTYEILDNIKAPIKKGDVVGKVVVRQDGEVLEVNLISHEDVLEKSYLDSLNEVLMGW